MRTPTLFLIGCVVMSGVIVINSELRAGTPPCSGTGITIPGVGSPVHELAPDGNTHIDLGDADPITAFLWESAPDTGNGIYDPGNWAVIFKYTSVNIEAGETVTFENHPSNAPVVWLVSGDVTIDGTIDVTGEDSNNLLQNPIGGPGGFRGGKGGLLTSTPGSGGFGPGGAGYMDNVRGGGAFADHGVGPLGGVPYGNLRILPLVGGSGGASRDDGAWSGGAGGGAILIAARGTITIGGTIDAGAGHGNSGGNGTGGGSGGAIRLIGDVVTGSGQLTAGPGIGSGQNNGSDGRIHIESTCRDFTSTGNPPFTEMTLGGDPAATDIFPLSPLEGGSTTPTLEATEFELSGGMIVPIDDDPNASFNLPDADSQLTAQVSPVTLRLMSQNILTPVEGGAWEVSVLVTPRAGNTQCLVATHESGTEASATWTVSITMPHGFSALSARADPPGTNVCSELGG
jgi:filamentous hemagglutinin family protein